MAKRGRSSAGKKNLLAKHKESKTHIRKAATAARQARLSDNALGKGPSTQDVGDHAATKALIIKAGAAVR